MGYFLSGIVHIFALAIGPAEDFSGGPNSLLDYVVVREVEYDQHRANLGRHWWISLIGNREWILDVRRSDRPHSFLDKLVVRPSEVEKVGERLGLGVRDGVLGSIPAIVAASRELASAASNPVSLSPGSLASLPLRNSAVATLPGAFGGRGSFAGAFAGPVSLNISIDARGATKEDAQAIGDRVGREVRRAFDEISRQGQVFGPLDLGGVT